MSTHLSYSFVPLHVCQSVCDTLPCTRFSVLFFCICMPVYLPVRHIHTHNVFHMCLCVCVFASICPYIMFTAMCQCVCLPHSCILYVPFVHFYDCLSIYVSLCMSVLFFCICMPVYLHIRHIRTHNVFHMCWVVW